MYGLAAALFLWQTEGFSCLDAHAFQQQFLKPSYGNN